MKQRILYVIGNGGDGSAYVLFFKDEPGVAAKLDALEEADPENWAMSEGVHSFEIDGEFITPFDDMPEVEDDE